MTPVRTPAMPLPCLTRAVPGFVLAQARLTGADLESVPVAARAAAELLMRRTRTC